MVKNTYTISSKLSRRNILMYYCRRFLSIVNNKILENERIVLTFVCVKSPRHSFSMYWKIFISEDNIILDVSREIGLLLGIESYNESVLKTSVYGMSVQEDICSKLSRVFYRVFAKDINFSYNIYDGSVE